MTYIANSMAEVRSFLSVKLSEYITSRSASRLGDFFTKLIDTALCVVPFPLRSWVGKLYALDLCKPFFNNANSPVLIFLFGLPLLLTVIMPMIKPSFFLPMAYWTVGTVLVIVWSSWFRPATPAEAQKLADALTYPEYSIAVGPLSSWIASRGLRRGAVRFLLVAFFRDRTIKESAGELLVNGPIEVDPPRFYHYSLRLTLFLVSSYFRSVFRSAVSVRAPATEVLMSVDAVRVEFDRLALESSTAPAPTAARRADRL